MVALRWQGVGHAQRCDTRATTWTGCAAFRRRVANGLSVATQREEGLALVVSMGGP